MSVDICPESEAAREVELEQVFRHLQCRLCGYVTNLGLGVHDGGLVLSGYARTYYAKQLAQHALMEATHIPILANEIEVH